MLGIGLAILAAIFFGSSSVPIRLASQHIKPVVGTVISLVASLVVVAVVTLIFDFDKLLSVSLMTVLWFGLVGFLNFTTGRLFIFLSIKYIGASKATPVYSTAPFFAIIMAVIFAGETVTIPIAIGAVTIVGGLFLLMSSE